MTMVKSSPTNITKDEVSKLTVSHAVMNGIPVDFSDTEAVQAYVAMLTLQNAEYQKKEVRRQVEISLKAKKDAEPRFTSFRDKLIIRRTPNADEIAPACDVFDFIEAHDVKRKHFPDNKRIFISSREFAAYQEMKSEGHIIDITYSQVVDRIQSKGTGSEVEVETEDAETNAE